MSLHQNWMRSVIILIIHSRLRWSLYHLQRKRHICHRIGSRQILIMWRLHLTFLIDQIQMWVLFVIKKKTVYKSIITNKFFYFDQSDEFPSKSDEQTVNNHGNHPFKAEMKFTLSSKKTLHPPPHKKPLNPYLKSPSFLLDISDSDVSFFF